MVTKPQKPTPDYPLFPHASRQWAKKVGGKLRYFGSWADPDAALARYTAWLAGEPRKRSIIPRVANGAKPHPDFPLYRHPTGQWAKRVQGKLHYFGTDPEAALARWLKEKDDLLAGRKPSNGEGLTIHKLANHFLTSKKRKVESREMTARNLDDHKRICKRVMDLLGENRIVTSLRPVDFEKLRAKLAESHGPVTLSYDIGRIRSMFKYASDAELIEHPVKFGPDFKKPKRDVLRKHRQKKEKRMFQAAELRIMLTKATAQLRAMIYLGINCGLANTDCAMLPKNALDLDRGWLNFPRPKTGIERRCPLWPETIEALRAAAAVRPTPRKSTHRDRVFITKDGNTWEPKSIPSNPISQETTRLLQREKIHRNGLSFYALRHTFQTIGSKTQDRDAVRYIMGHAEKVDDMSAVYNEEAPDDDRLRGVTNYVRDWLFPPTLAKKKEILT